MGSGSGVEYIVMRFAISTRTTLLLLLAVSAIAAGPQATVRPLDGDSVKGRITALSADKVIVETSSAAQEFATSKLMWVEWITTPPAEKATIWIELLEGSRLNATGFTAAGGKSLIELATGQVLELPARSVRSVRFHQQTPELAGQWRDITSSMATGDMVVIRKTSMRTIEDGENEPRTVTEQALDQLEGALLDVTPDSVRFEIDGEKVNIRREKLEGLVYFQPNKREFLPPLCRLTDASGSTFLVRDAQLDDHGVQFTTLGGVALGLPFSGVARIDFSIGNVAFLADLEPDSGLSDLILSLQPAAMTYKFTRLIRTRPTPPPGAPQFRIGGESFENGLTLHGATKLVYRVPEGFRRFRASAGVDDSFTSPGHFDLVVLGDGKELLRQIFGADKPRRPVSIDLDVAKVRRVTIQLELSGGQDIGDQLDLCEARFTK
jgi:hypothetical protein